MKMKCIFHFYVLNINISQSDPTLSIVVIWVNFFQTELMVERCSKSLVRAMGKVLLINCS